MKFKVNLTDILTATLLVCMGVVLRLGLEDYPNVSPVAALALLAGYILRGRVLALAVPLIVLTMSDLYFGGYAPKVMVSVYALLALPALAGRSLNNFHQNQKSPALSVASVGATGLGFSVLFFLGTNLAVWSSSSFYSMNLTGLLECYTAALPFFRQTILGDMIFVSLFFGSYAMGKVWLTSKADQLVAE
jgi:hypothetical protein